MSETWNTLQVARDARLDGRADVASRLYEEVAPDFAYVRRSHRRTVMPFWFDDGIDEYDEPYEVAPVAEQRASWRAGILAIDWMSWSNPLRTTSMDSFLKEMYSDARISEMAYAPNPFLSMIRKDPDGIECRIGSYANLIQPVTYGTFLISGDE